MNGYVETVELLVQIGKCDVDIKGLHNATPMHYASMGCQLKMMECLLQLGSRSINSIGGGESKVPIAILACGIKYTYERQVNNVALIENLSPLVEAFIRMAREYGQPIDLGIKLWVELTILDMLISYTRAEVFPEEGIDDRFDETIRLLIALGANSKFRTNITITEEFAHDVRHHVYFESSLTSMLLKQLSIR